MSEDQNRNEVNKQEERPKGVRASLKSNAGTIVSVVLSFTICVAIFFVFFRFDGLVKGISSFTGTIASVVFGVIIAYLINPAMKFFDKHFSLLAEKSKKGLTPKRKKMIRVSAVVLALLVFFAIIILLMVIVWPPLVACVQELTDSIGENIGTIRGWFEKVTGPQMQDGILSKLISNIFNSLKDWLTDQVQLLTQIATGVVSALKFFINLLVGFVIAVYILLRKEWLKALTRKIVTAMLPSRAGNVTLDVLKKANTVFGGFLVGKVIDSLIIGVISYVVLWIMKMPYGSLIAVIIGCTNVIPFFGPFIGAIPSVLLVVSVRPIMALYLAIFIFVLQQVDGNIIGPKILGDSTGLSPLCVIIAIMIFGGRFGFGGMIFGVPIFAVIYYIIKVAVEAILKWRKMPSDTEDYAVKSKEE